MSQKIGSTFLKEFEDYEPPFWWKLTWRQSVFLIGCLLLTGIAVIVTYYQLPTFIIYLVGGVVIPPFFIYGTNKEGKLFDWLQFHLKVHHRPYQTERERSYSPHEFIQQKSVKEEDLF